MSIRRRWPVTLGVLFVGSVGVLVEAADGVPAIPSPGKPTETVEKPVDESRKPVKPKELGDSVKKGLEYLIGQQHDNGGFGQGGGWRISNQDGNGRVEGKEVKDPPDLGNTCVAALALIRAGNTPKDGKYATPLTKAIEFIETSIEQSDSDSLYVTPVRDTQLQSKIGRYVDTFLAALVLSELKGQMPDKKSEDRLFAALNKTIGKIESNQGKDGNFAGNSGWASVLSQGLCSKALSRASQKGVAVKAETLKRDLDQTVAQLAPAKPVEGKVAVGGPVAEITATSGLTPPTGRGGSTAALGGAGPSGKSDAGVLLYSIAANGSRVQDAVNSTRERKDKAKTVLNSPAASDESKTAARSELKLVEEAEVSNVEAAKQLEANINDGRFLKGFGNNGGEEFLSYMNISETLLVKGGETWEKWDRQICDTIGKAQNEDGSWSGHHCITGRTFCTSAALLTMMADRAPLPEIAEAKPQK